jgi:D-alanyl-D-alanine carboxypeptidase/D-alanyl-D-alanine-endopeptidase (penicillin-binding protein 4)
MLSCSLTFVLALTAGAPADNGVDGGVRAALKQRISELLATPAFGEAEIGLLVERLDDGVELYALEPDTLLVPASNVKILTTAAALHFLGPDRRFRTEIAGKVDSNGVVSGDLVIKGYGDPWLVPERLWYLANRLHFQNVKTVKGNLIVDGSYFAGPILANGWEQDRTSLAYMAPAGALSVGFNALLVHVSAGPAAGDDAVVLIDPASDYAAVEGRVETVSRGRTSIDVEVEPLRDRSVIKIEGRINKSTWPRAYWRRVDNPAVYAGEVFKSVLKQVGVNVKGRVQEGLMPEGAEIIAAVSSPSLAEIVHRINKHSSNFMAAQVAYILGAELYGPPGTWEKGRQAIETFLEEQVGIARGSYVLGNASGLHDVNRLSPRQLVRVLDHMRQQPELEPEFLSSLAVAGSSGTLADRMRESDAERLLRAKTGTMSTALALSGYVTCQSGELIGFSLLINAYRAPIRDLWAAEDALGALLAGTDFSRAHVPSTSLSSAPPLTEADPP